MTSRLLFLTCMPLSEPKSASMAFMGLVLQAFPGRFAWFSLRGGAKSEWETSGLPYAGAKIAAGPARPTAFRLVWRYFISPRWQARQAARFARQQGCSAVLADLAFEAVITGRLTARRLGVPLLVNIHDDPPSRLSVKGLPSWFLRWYERQFTRTLRAAQKVGVISDYMGEYYQQRYDVRTQTLYPGVEATASARPGGVPTQDEPLWVGSVGSINSPENWQTLLAAIQLLNAQNGRGRYRVLHIGQPPRSLPAGEGVEFTGWLPPAEFNHQLARLSVGFLNMPFGSDLAQGARLSFPLKLSSLLGAGCPLLAFGPEGSSVVRLVRQYACGAVCTEPNALALAAALESVTNDGAARQTALQGVEKLRADLSRDKFLAAFETFITV